MVGHVTDFLLEKTLGWPSGVAINKVNTHHYYIRSFYTKSIQFLLNSIPNCIECINKMNSTVKLTNYSC